MFKHTHKTKIILIVAAFLFGSGTREGWCASVAGKVREGNKLYEKGDFASSINQYEEALKKNSESDVINYNLGTAYYKNGDYTKSIEHLQKSLLDENKELQTKAHFNLGNSLYKSGIGQEKKNLDLAISSLEQSLTHYDGILKQEKEDVDAQANYDFVKKELERLKRKKEQEHQQKQQQNQKQDNQDQNKSDGSKGDSQEQDQQNQQNQEQNQSKKTDSSSDQQANHQQNESKDGSSDENKEQDSPQDNGKTSSEEYNNKNKAGSTGNAKVMTEQEAKDLLETYGQTEEPKGLLNFQQKRSGTQPVLKDW